MHTCVGDKEREVLSTEKKGKVSTWVIFAGLMSPYDSNVFCFIIKNLNKNFSKKVYAPIKLISTPKVTYFSIL